MNHYIISKLKSLKDQSLNTGIEFLDLIEGEVFEGKFKNQQVIDNLVDIDVLAKVPPITPICKIIPVVRSLVVEKPKQLTILKDFEGNDLPLSSL